MDGMLVCRGRVLGGGERVGVCGGVNPGPNMPPVGPASACPWYGMAKMAKPQRCCRCWRCGCVGSCRWQQSKPDAPGL